MQRILQVFASAISLWSLCSALMPKGLDVSCYCMTCFLNWILLRGLQGEVENVVEALEKTLIFMNNLRRLEQLRCSSSLAQANLSPYLLKPSCCVVDRENYEQAKLFRAACKCSSVTSREKLSIKEGLIAFEVIDCHCCKPNILQLLLRTRTCVRFIFCRLIAIACLSSVSFLVFSSSNLYAIRLLLVIWSRLPVL